MRPGHFLAPTPANIVPLPPTWSGASSSFEYDEAWAGTISNTDYPATFTGFSTPADETPLESFEYAGGWSGTLPPATAAIAVAELTSTVGDPTVSAYGWSSNGFGFKYADPATAPVTTSNRVAFSPSGAALAVAHSPSPYVSAYPWSSSGFGTKYANPSSLPPANATDVTFSPAGNALAVSYGSSPYVSAYPWSGAGFGTKYADPATPLGGNLATGVAFSPDGNALAISHYQTAPSNLGVSAYQWSSSTGFGAKYADPAEIPVDFSAGESVAFSPDGTAIAIASKFTPFVVVYGWSSGSGFGAKYSDPSTLPGTWGLDVAFSPAGTEIAVAHEASPYVSAYPWSSSTGFGAKYADPSTPPTNTGTGVAFSSDGTAIAVAHYATPLSNGGVSVYGWSSSGFGTKYVDPTTPVPNGANGVAFSAPY